MVLDPIRTQNQELQNRVNSSTSPHAEKINNILKEFEGFAENYKSLWKDLSEKISNGQQNIGATEAIDKRLNDLWLILEAIINQYIDSEHKSRVEDGMKYLDAVITAHPKLFPSNQPRPDVLIFIEETNRLPPINIARKYPYSNTFFIGINSASVNSDNPAEADWKPIAHELGHYIYWSSCFDTKGSSKFAELEGEPVFSEDISQALQTEEKPSASKDRRNRALTALMASWSEEMFADVVGTSLLGEEYALSSQDLFRRQSESGDHPRFTDDIEHPIPYLRPFVCAEALKLVGDNDGDALWAGFKGAVEKKHESTNLAPQNVSVGLLSTDETKSSDFEEVSFDIPTIEIAISKVIPVLYDRLQTKKARIDQPLGIDLIKAKIQDVFTDSYIDISVGLEKGDGPGFLRTSRRRLQRLIRRVFRRH